MHSIGQVSGSFKRANVILPGGHLFCGELLRCKLENEDTRPNER